MGRVALLLAYCLGFVWVLHSRAEQCGSQAGGALCPGGLCCSRFGWCGSTAPYCDRAQGCQSQCWGLTLSPPPPLRSSPPPPPRPSPPPPPRPSPPPPPRPPPPPPPPSQPPSGGVASIISQTLFDQMLLHRNDAACPARNFYTYNAFITAANSFPAFGTTGDLATRKREIAAFFGQTSHETTGGWATAPDGPYSWGYCFKEELGNPGDYCQPSTQWPCVSGKKYYGRGPVQISYNYNYGPAGQAIGVNLLNNPDLVASDPAVSFKTALWFWMTPQSPKPSSHSVITGGWTPSAADVAAGRQPGYGVITNIINGGLECGRGPDGRVAD